MTKLSSFPKNLRIVTNQRYQVTKKVERLYGLIGEQTKQDR